MTVTTMTPPPPPAHRNPASGIPRTKNTKQIVNNGNTITQLQSHETVTSTLVVWSRILFTKLEQKNLEHTQRGKARLNVWCPSETEPALVASLHQSLGRGGWQSEGGGHGPRALLSGSANEQLFRSVEGQAASDKEEEEEEEKKKKWQEEQRTPAAEVKSLLARLSSCGGRCVAPSGSATVGLRCDDQTAEKLMTYFGHFGGADHARTLGELEACVAMLETKLNVITRQASVATAKPSSEAELQQKVEENEHLRLELQMVETERVRLSLLEEKLVDVLQLLQRLRDLELPGSP
ncbi:hypothetical protein P7K49_030634 [Saguinus oedipus]|uniref:Uncharacterized protein n=1 Tax=Saguinus oedipus TaxID=9490 RepID=A0ABQ9U3J9_SAGOE|nr:hypothetical protein P7K49_030634 [Saguinus oedipus]